MRDLTFRDFRPEDEATLFQLFAAVRAEELAMDTWPEALREQMLRLQFDGQWRGYRDEYPRADMRIILHGGRPIGWVVVDRSGAALHGIDIALLAEERSRGVGTTVIRALQQEAAADARPMVITVLRSNVRARALYERLGYRPLRDTEMHTVMEWRAEPER